MFRLIAIVVLLLAFAAPAAACDGFGVQAFGGCGVGVQSFGFQQFALPQVFVDPCVSVNAVAFRPFVQRQFFQRQVIVQRRPFVPAFRQRTVIRQRNVGGARVFVQVH